MKKYLILLTILLVCSIGFSQTAFRQTASNSSGTITDTGVDTMVIALSSPALLVTIQPVITRASGTMAGTSILSYSVNGTNYVNTDTLTLTNAVTNNTVWNKQSAARYWRIITGGATTVSGTASAKISVSR